MNSPKKILTKIHGLDLSGRSRPVFWSVETFRLFYHLFEEFVRDRCLQTAASLAFTTLLALVPILAISLSIVSRVKFSQESFQHFLFEHLFPSISAQTMIMETIQKLSQNLATFSVLGLLFLTIISVSLLNTVEGAFNAIWRVSESRSLLSKFSSFWSVITFSPILVASSIFLSGKFGETTIGGILLRYPYFQALAKYGLPNAMIFAAVMFMYYMLPYTKVKALPAVVGSMTATLLFQLARKGFEFYIVRVATFDKLYGILGAVPVFLIWIYLSWVVVLLGAEIVYTLQYHQASKIEKPKSVEADVCDGYYALRVVMAVGERFLKGLEPISVNGLAERLNVPVQPLERLLVRLKEAKILAPIDQAQQVYVPVRDLGGVTPKDIVESVGTAPFVVPRFSEDVQSNGVSGLFKKAREAVNRILISKSVTDLLTGSEVEELSEDGDQNQPLP